MDADEPRILDLAGAILDGEAVDWAALASTASDSQRSTFAELHAVAAISSLRRRQLPLPMLVREPVLPESATWGKLTILEAIGHGAFGTVYRAWDSQLDREVALKLLSANEDGVSTLEEGRLLARVHHPNVVTIFGADRIGTHVGLWMELLRGETLERALAKEGTFTASRVAVVGRQLCDALAAVHRAGLVHRDVKAHNVMLEPGGRLVLMDFGSGRPALGDHRDVAGTPLYLAPEIFAGAAATEQSDIYSVGVLLYHLLTAGYPIVGRTVREVRAEHQRATTGSDVRAIRPDVPRWLSIAIDRALAARPDDRFRSADEMRASLSRTADPSTTTHRFLLGFAATTAAVAIVAAGGVLKWSRSRQSRAPALAIGTEQPTTRRLPLPRAQLAGSGLSRDGRYFSFLDETGSLSVFNMSSGQTEALVPSDDEQFPEFSIMSPDGDRVAYQWWTNRRTYEIRLVDRATKSVRVLLRDDALDDPLPVEWSSDGSEILVWLKNLQGMGQVALVNVSSGALQNVCELRSQEPLGMSLSPDAAYIAYDAPVSPGNPARALHIVDRRDRRDRILPTEAGANDRFPLWTPDGRSLFFISDRSGSSDGWLIPVQNGVAGGEPTLVTRNLGRVSALGMTAAGAFYYRLQAGAFDINEIGFDPSTMTFVTEPHRVPRQLSGSNIGPSYSADGQYLAYVSVRDGLGGKAARALVVKNLDTGAERELAVATGNAPARWSPDGQRLLLGSRVVDAMTGQLQHEFNTHPGRDQSSYGPTRWAVDGQSVIYEHEDRGLMRHPLTGGVDEPVYPYSLENTVKRIHRFELSPDGLRIAYSGFLRDGTGSVLRVTTPAGEVELARRIFPELVVVQGWSADGQIVLFTTLRTNVAPPHDLWRVSVREGRPERLGSIDGATQINPMAFNPIRSTLAFTTGTPLNELWMMENFLPRERR